MPRHNPPAQYRAPLKSRKAIVEFLTSHRSYRRNLSTGSPLAWNVKDYGSDLSFNHLVEVYRNSGDAGPWLDYHEFLNPARDRYEEVKDRLWDMAIESARDNVQSFDCYRNLWDGTSLDVAYEFHGRSGGWLLMVRYDGKRLDRMEDYEFRDWLEEMEFSELRKLYRLVVQNDHDFRPEAVSAEIEHHAAFQFFENACSDIVRPDATQLSLAFVD